MHDRRNETFSGGATGRLQEAWIRRLRWHYDVYNDQYVGGKLKPPLIRIGSSTQRLGAWDPETRALTLSERHILEHPWETVLDTLRHEMAHQYVDEVLRLSHAPPHGDPFARACRLLRCDPSPSATSGRLGKLHRSSATRDKILLRIKELLALAESPNEHEAANAMRMAHKYLLKYNLDLADLDAKSSYANCYLGRCSGRIQEYEYTLSTILQDQFFVLVIWTFSYDSDQDKPGRMLQISGTPANVEMAEYVYDYVMNLAARLWEKQRGARRRRGTKCQYLAGVLRGLAEKLDLQKDELKEEHGLVWLGDPELSKYFKNLHPCTRSVSMTGVSRSDQYEAGVRDGKEIKIHRGVTHGAGNRGRQLPGPKGVCSLRTTDYRPS